MSLIKYGYYNPTIKNEFIQHFDHLIDSMLNKNFPTLTDEVDDDFFQKGSFPKVNIFSQDDNFVIEASVSGYKKEDISVQVKGNLLTISGKSKSRNTKDAKFYFREIKLSNFSRTFKLNDSMIADKMSAESKDGLLTIKIPFANKEKDFREVKNIKIS